MKIMSFNKRKIRSKGFNLIEVLVSLFILMFCIFLIVEIFPNSVKAVRMGKKIVLANQIAHRELEFAKSLSWDDLSEENTVLQNRKTSITTKVNGIPSTTDYRTFFNISRFTDDPDNIKVVKVTVRWDLDQNNQGADRKKVEMELLVSRN